MFTLTIIPIIKEQALGYKASYPHYALIWLQRLPPACCGTAQRKIFHLANWSQVDQGVLWSRVSRTRKRRPITSAVSSSQWCAPEYKATTVPLLGLLQERHWPVYQLHVYKMLALGTFKMVWSLKCANYQFGEIYCKICYTSL